MKNRTRFSCRSFMTGLAGIFIAVALLTLTGPGTALAAAGTSGGTTIHNWVSVSYTSGTFTPPAVTAFVDVTVITVASAATITTPAGKTVIPGAFVTYSSTVFSNANGIDTYNLGPASPTTSVSGISGSPATALNGGAAITLWGGITVGAASSGQAVLSFPGGSLTGSGLVNGSKIVILGTVYTVSSISVGSPNTNVGGTSNEALGTITLTTNLASAVAAGTQVGEQKSFAITFTAGNPTAAGTDGIYNTVVTATTTATTLAGATQSVSTTGTQTVVESPKLTITKAFKVVASGTAVPATVTPGSYTGGQAKPGQVIEYLITIVNNNTNVLSAASNVTVTDPISSPYVTYVANSTYSANGNTTLGAVADPSLGVSKLVGGYTFGSSIAGGNNAGATAYIIYQVLVQ